jgi:hypothetical protein
MERRLYLRDEWSQRIVGGVEVLVVLRSASIVVVDLFLNDLSITVGVLAHGTNGREANGSRSVISSFLIMRIGFAISRRPNSRVGAVVAPKSTWQSARLRQEEMNQTVSSLEVERVLEALH